jgi:DNA-binding response OmpR family regulator
LLTDLGNSELAQAGTSLSPAELQLLVLIDGKASVKELQANAAHLAPGAVIEVLDKLLHSGHIALQGIDLGDFFGAGTTPEWKGEVPSDSAIARGVSTLQQDGYVVRIARRPPTERKPVQDKKPLVMVVEDEQRLADNMRIVLTRSGFVVRTAANREQIVAALRQPPLPDLVLLDVMLPDTNGFEVLAKMRQHPILADVPVIMVTGTATREAVLTGLMRGANGYITKPFQIHVLIKAVKTVLGVEAGDQAAVRGSVPDAAESARPGGVAIPGAPAAEPAPEREAFVASPGSLLARLRQAALAKRRQEQEEQKSDSKEQMISGVSDALKRAYQNLKELAAQLELVKPAYAKEYTLAGVPDFDELKWEEVRADFGIREISLTTRAYEQVTLNFHLSANKKLSVTREAPADEKLEQLLEDTRIRFTTEPMRNDRGALVRTTFLIPCEVRASLQLIGNFDTGKLLLKIRNVGNFGTVEHVLAPETITDDWLRDLSHFILGESRRIGPLLMKGA